MNRTSATSTGRTHDGRSFVRGATANGLALTFNACSFFQTRPSSASLKPAPVCPM